MLSPVHPRDTRSHGLHVPLPWSNARREKWAKSRVVPDFASQGRGTESIPLPRPSQAGYSWADTKDLNRTALQYYILAPIDASADAAPSEPQAAFRNVSSVVGVAAEAGMVVVGPAGTSGGSVGVTFDFGVETASWLELDVAGLSPGDLGKLVLASGEANQVTFVGGYKRGTPKAYYTTESNTATISTLRLETNGELYEGMRYGFLTVTAPLANPFVVTAVRAVVQVRELESL